MIGFVGTVFPAMVKRILKVDRRSFGRTRIRRNIDLFVGFLSGLQIYSMALSMVALIAWIFVYAIPRSSTPLLRLCPPDKCFRCCLPSLRSGLNWSWYAPVPYCNFADNCNRHHTHIHIRSACAGKQTYSSCRMLWTWCWGCTAHHRWDKITPDWCGFALPFLPLPFSLLGTKKLL